MLAGCGLHLRPGGAPSSVDELVITQEEIADLGVHTAWEAIKRKVPQLTYSENRAGQPTRIWRHGRGSIMLNETPMLIVDGVRIDDIRALGDIPASQVERIRIRSGLASSAEYGTNSSGGVIFVETRSGN
jgi:outer membrane receptor for ferrienterochelin and colicin